MPLRITPAEPELYAELHATALQSLTGPCMYVWAARAPLAAGATPRQHSRRLRICKTSCEKRTRRSSSCKRSISACRSWRRAGPQLHFALQARGESRTKETGHAQP